MTRVGGNGQAAAPWQDFRPTSAESPPEFDEAIRDAVCAACYDVFGDDSEHKWEGIAERILEEIVESAAALYVAVEQREIEAAENSRRVLSLEGARRVITLLREQGHSDGCACTLCRASRMVGHSYGVGF